MRLNVDYESYYTNNDIYKSLLFNIKRWTTNLYVQQIHLIVDRAVPPLFNGDYRGRPQNSYRTIDVEAFMNYVDCVDTWKHIAKVRPDLELNI